MSEYVPDRWVVLKINENKETIYKVLGSWRGGYISGDSWRLNSGITGVKENGHFLEFYGNSGSLYKCYKEYYGTTGYSYNMYLGYKEQGEKLGTKIEILNEKDAINIVFWQKTLKSDMHI